MGLYENYQIANVSIHTPTWGVTECRLFDGICISVSIHTPTWGVTPRFFISLLMSRSFNPHTYMRCDRAGNSLTTWLTVSIHTPTWGVTISSWTISVGKEFQSTHLHEVWRQRSLHIPPTISFNPHTYMRCDKHYANLPTYNKVSIHTPTWGVTVVITTGVDPVSFNPHTYMRCDRISNRCELSHSKFQSTHLHEVWPCMYRWKIQIRGFNPHTYMRCDGHEAMVLMVVPLFQSTHLHEVWLSTNFFSCRFSMFQSTHLHEVWRPWGDGLDGSSLVSIHTPTWGVTQYQFF